MSTSSHDFDRVAVLATPEGVERRVGVHGVLAALGLATAPVRCGRFVLGDKLGEGAMGVVYRARDPELGRDVAIKVLRERDSPELAARLRTEARALARLAHPNVVGVLGIGVDHGRTWIAMELVAGRSLAQWAADRGPGAPEAVAVLWAAAQGLAAAHAAGLVHRDLKPANILVGDDGSVKVADFGLARADAISITDGEGSASTTQVRVLDRTSRQTGALVGTPLYMAPEQHLRQGADARSDQFAFAVTAWEVLTGRPPFGGRTSGALLDAIERRRFEPVPPHAIPRRLRAVLERALAAEAGERYASMPALLAAWARAQRPTRRRAIVALSVAAGVAAVWVARAPAVGCDGGRATAGFARIWDAPRRATIAAAIQDAGPAWSDATLVGLDDAMQQQAQAWRHAELLACEAARRDPQAQAGLDRHARCLARALGTTDAWLDRLEHATPTAAERVISAAEGLELPDACLDDGTWSVTPAAAALERELAGARADLLTADWLGAQREALRIDAAAQAAGLDHVRSEALTIAAVAASELFDPASFEYDAQAHALAVAADRPSLAIEPAVAASMWLAHRARIDEARQWLRHAQTAVARQGGDGDWRPDLARAECAILEEEGALDEALARCNDGLRWLGDDRPKLASRLRTRIVGLLQLLGRYDEALTLAIAQRDAFEATGDSAHPRIAGAHLNVGNAAHRTGDHALARASFVRAAEIFIANYGELHPWVVSARMNLGALLHTEEDYVGAEAVLERALASCGQRRDAATARVLHNLAEVRRELGRPEEALTLLERAALIEADVLPEGHRQNGFTHHTRGNILLDLGRLERAAAELAAADAILIDSGTSTRAALEDSMARLQSLRAAAPP